MLCPNVLRAGGAVWHVSHVGPLTLHAEISGQISHKTLGATGFAQAELATTSSEKQTAQKLRIRNDPVYDSTGFDPLRCRQETSRNSDYDEGWPTPVQVPTEESRLRVATFGRKKAWLPSTRLLMRRRFFVNGPVAAISETDTTGSHPVFQWQCLNAKRHIRFL